MQKTQRSRPSPSPTHFARIALDAIATTAQQLRHDPDDESLIELALDIQTRGLLQPIGVSPLPNERYQLLYGSRRLAAHRHLNASHIDASVRTDNQPITATALAENVHRRQLSLADEVEAVNFLHTEHDRSPEQIAGLLSKSRAWVLRRLAVPQLPTDLREPLLNEKITLGAAEELARIEDAPTRAWCLDQAKAGRLSITDIRSTREACEQNATLAPLIASAVAAGAALEAPPTITYECAACHQARPHEQLRVVRICSEGCPDHQPATQ